MKRGQGFTLIELLIVVTIIGIPAAIAVPNFLNAQTRAMVARVKADLRAVSVAIDSYRLDNNDHPYKGGLDGYNDVSRDMNAEMLDLLTTPVSYIGTARLTDPFKPGTENAGWNSKGYFQYMTFTHPVYKGGSMYRDCYIIFSFGPDRLSSSLDWL